MVKSKRKVIGLRHQKEKWLIWEAADNAGGDRAPVKSSPVHSRVPWLLSVNQSFIMHILEKIPLLKYKHTNGSVKYKHVCVCIVN